MKILGVIPARYASTRFPKKSLADINGKSMIQRVYEQAQKSTLLTKVVVATDHEEIFKAASAFGNVYMTNDSHQSGTDRCAEALTFEKENYDFVINIQGDEPFIQPEQIDLLAGILTENVELATLIKEINDNETLFNSNTPKVIINNNSEAIYFSRSTIPYIRNAEKDRWLSCHQFYKHIGIYAYRTDILKKITRLPVGILEKAESLEQLRWLENGYKIKTAITNQDSYGIDTPEDLERILKHRG